MYFSRINFKGSYFYGGNTVLNIIIDFLVIFFLNILLKRIIGEPSEDEWPELQHNKIF